MTWLSLSKGVLKTNGGAPLAQLEKCWTRDHKVMDMNLNRGAVVTSPLRHTRVSKLSSGNDGDG